MKSTVLRKELDKRFKIRLSFKVQDSFGGVYKKRNDYRVPVTFHHNISARWHLEAKPEGLGRLGAILREPVDSSRKNHRLVAKNKQLKPGLDHSKLGH